MAEPFASALPSDVRPLLCVSLLYIHRLLDSALVKNLRKPRAKLTLKDSYSYLLGSRYLRYMATLVLGK